MPSLATRYVATAALVLSAFLSACGGGGTDTPPRIGTAEGLYSGSLAGTADSGFKLLVLEDGRFYAFLGLDKTPMSVESLLGSGTFQGGRISNVTANDYRLLGLGSSTGAGAYDDVSQTLTLTLTPKGSPFTLNALRIPTATYDYTAPAAPAQLLGDWPEIRANFANGHLTFRPDGTFAGATEFIALAGTFKPRSSGKNVFDVSLQRGTGQPAQPGIAVVWKTADGRSAFALAVEGGTALIGIR